MNAMARSREGCRKDGSRRDGLDSTEQPRPEGLPEFNKGSHLVVPW